MTSIQPAQTAHRRAWPSVAVLLRRAAFFVVCAALIVAFLGPLEGLWGNWQRPQYSHGPLIPLIAALLCWHDLARRKPWPEPSWLGPPVVMLGFVLLGLGTLSAFNSAALYGLVLIVTGLILAFLGREACRLSVPALVYLCFAIPLPDFLYVDMSARLQLISSSFAVDILDALGVPVAQDGNIIDLGQIKLQVAEACSGLRYVFPLASFSFLAAYVFRDRLWKRLVIFLSAAPIAIVLNVARVVIVGVSVQQWGIAAAEGFLHAFEGWVIFLGCVGLLGAEVWLLRRVHRLRGATLRLGYFDRPPSLAFAGRLRIAPASIVACAIVMVMALAANPLLARVTAYAIPDTETATSIPLSLGFWHGQRRALDRDVIDSLELNEYVLAQYREGADPAVVEYYVAYYRQQRVGSAVHSPANCIPGGGWAIESHAVVTVRLGPNHAPIRVNRMLISNDKLRRLVYYWFPQRGRDLIGEWEVKWYLLRDRILTGRSDGYLARLVTTVEDGQEAAAEQRLQRMLLAAQPYLPS